MPGECCASFSKFSSREPEDAGRADHYANAVAGDFARGRQGHADNARTLNAA